MEEDARRARFDMARAQFSSSQDKIMKHSTISMCTASESNHEISLESLSKILVETEAPPPLPPRPVPKRPTERPQQKQESRTVTSPLGPIGHIQSIAPFKRPPLVSEFKIPLQISSPSTSEAQVKNYRVVICGNNAVVSNQNSLYVLDVLTGECIKHLTMATPISALHYCPLDCILWTGTVDGSIFLLDSKNSFALLHHRAYAHSNHSVEQFCHFGEDMLSVDQTGVAIRWPKRALTLNSQALVFPSSTREILSCDQEIFAICGKLVKRYRLEGELVEIAAYDPAKFSIINIAAAVSMFIHNGCLVVMHEDGKILSWSLDCDELIHATSIGSSYKLVHANLVNQRYIWCTFNTGRIEIIDSAAKDVKDWTVYLDWKSHQSTILDMKSCSRFVVSVDDDDVVYIWDTGLKQAIKYYELRSRQTDFCTFIDEQVLVCSWNVGACKPPSLHETEFWNEWFCQGQSPSIIAVGLQEVVQLDSKRTNAKLLLGQGETGHVSKWVERLSDAVAMVHPSSRYTLLLSQNMVGLLLAVFVRNDQRHAIASASCDSVKTGLGGLHGNKGSLVARLCFNDSSICLVNVHLAAGHQKVASRNSDAGLILKTAKFVPAGVKQEQVFTNGGDGSCVEDMEHCLFFGDLNYRIDMERSDVLSLIDAKAFADLSLYDQIASQLGRNHAFPLASFTEGPLTFPPTYKFDPRSHQYDTSDKMRVPAWCDRVLYRCNNGVSEHPGSIVHYASVHSGWHSDHRPIHAILRLPIRFLDTDRYARAANDFSPTV